MEPGKKQKYEKISEGKISKDAKEAHERASAEQLEERVEDRDSGNGNNREGGKRPGEKVEEELGSGEIQGK